QRLGRHLLRGAGNPRVLPLQHTGPARDEEAGKGEDKQQEHVEEDHEVLPWSVQAGRSPQTARTGDAAWRVVAARALCRRAERSPGSRRFAEASGLLRRFCEASLNPSASDSYPTSMTSVIDRALSSLAGSLPGQDKSRKWILSFFGGDGR